MANVREVDSVSGDRLYLGGGGVTLAGWGMMWVGRLMTLAGTQPIFAAVNSPGNTAGVLYYDATSELSMGWASGDSNTTAFTLNTTDLWLLGFTKAAGTTVVRFHAANLTTGAAAAHANSAGTTGDLGSTWNKTEVGSADDGGFQGLKRHGTAAIFTSVYSDGDFEAVAAAKSTQAIGDLAPARLWDFNQASVATAIVNLMTGSADETTDTSTTVVNDTAFDIWTFGYTPGGTDATVTGVVSGATADAPAGTPTASAGTDDFETRPNGTLDAPWMAWFSGSMPTVTGGVVYAGVAAGSSTNATYAVATDSADTMTEIVFETALTPGNVESFMAGARLTAHSSSADGYTFQLSDEAPAGTGTTIRPRLYRGNGFTVIATGSNIASSAIDAMRLTCIGDQITGYARISGVWTNVVSVTDATYSAAGYPGFSVRQPTGAAPDNGAESVSWGPVPGTDATVTAVPAVAAADAPAGVLSAGSTVTGAVASALADAPPANQMISAVVNAPLVMALADAPLGAATAGGDATVIAVPAVAAADAPAGVVSADAQVAGVVADAAADAPAGVLSAGATVAGVVAGAAADAPRAGLSPDPGGDSGGNVAATFAEGVQ